MKLMNCGCNEVNELWMYLSQISSKAFKLVQNPSFQISENDLF